MLKKNFLVSAENAEFKKSMNYGAMKQVVNFLLDRLRLYCSTREGVFERVIGYIILSSKLNTSECASSMNLFLTEENNAFIEGLPMGSKAKVINYLLDQFREACKNLEEKPEVFAAQITVGGLPPSFLIIPKDLKDDIEADRA